MSQNAAAASTQRRSWSTAWTSRQWRRRRAATIGPVPLPFCQKRRVGWSALARGALILCTNTMHVVADAIQSGVSVPLLHIVEPTGQALLHAGVQRAALLGTRFTMERPFWRARLEEQFRVMLEVPARTARAEVHRIIYEELCLGVVLPASRTSLERTMSDLADAGAEAIILGCTELTLLVGTANVPLPIFDTTTLHAAEWVAWLLNDESPCE